MAVNLVTLVSQFLTPDLIAKIARTLGLDTSVAGKALVAAVPGLLGSLAGTASTQDGSQRVFDAVASQRGGTVEGLAAALGGSGKDTFIQNSNNMLSSVLGGSAAQALAGVVGNYAGLGQGAGSSLLGLLAPIVMGVLGRQKTESALDASGLSRLLASQKDNISAALPTGIADSLRAAGVPGFSGTSATGAQAARATRSDFDQVYRDQGIRDQGIRLAKPGLPAWAAWVIPLVAVAAVAAWLLGRSPPQVAPQAGPQVAPHTADQATTTPAQNLSVGDVNVGSALQATLGGVRTALQGITDSSSAEAALPKLHDATAQLDKLVGLSTQLGTAARTTLANLVTAERPSVEAQFSRVLALPGVAPIAKPAIDQFRDKLDALAARAS